MAQSQVDRLEKEKAKSQLLMVLGPILGRESLEGLEVGPYILHRYLGSGYSGDVYEASLSQAGSEDSPRYALKFYKLQHLQDQDQLRRIRREVEFGKTISHPNLMKIYGFVEKEKVGPFSLSYLIMERLYGNTLAELIKNNRPDRVAFPLESAISIGIQVLTGLKAMHSGSEPHIHRDIKPQNIFITTEGVVKIMDFGLVKPPTDYTVSFGLENIGTPRYSAPEVLFSGKCDHRADLYSLGAVLYELVYGQPVFPFEDSVPNLIVAIKNNKVVCGLPKSLNNADGFAIAKTIERLLEKEPGMRFQSADEVIQTLILRRGSNYMTELLAETVKTAFMDIGLMGSASERDKVARIVCQLSDADVDNIVTAEGADTRTLLLMQNDKVLKYLNPLEFIYIADIAFGVRSNGTIRESLREKAQAHREEVKQALSRAYNSMTLEEKKKYLNKLQEMMWKYWRSSPEIWMRKRYEVENPFAYLIELEADPNMRAILEKRKRFVTKYWDEPFIYYADGYFDRLKLLHGCCSKG
jgi:serine/threonine protein kinase